MHLHEIAIQTVHGHVHVHDDQRLFIITAFILLAIIAAALVLAAFHHATKTNNDKKP